MYEFFGRRTLSVYQIELQIKIKIRNKFHFDWLKSTNSPNIRQETHSKGIKNYSVKENFTIKKVIIGFRKLFNRHSNIC